MNLSLVGIDSTTVRAHHNAARTHLGKDVVTALEKAAAEEEKARSEGGSLEEQSGQDATAVAVVGDLLGHGQLRGKA
ncbi:hypothetical protein [Streptomyces durhamensis]|uniref:hypothetical protein n=1 Tax=Streptomyces durhamensis TaxID=68194 RepID=UPI00068E7325|nr:hypothetical protein [Streptomyces durhamensis]